MLFTIFLFILLILQTQSADDSCQPQQIHIALSDAFSDNSSNSTIKVIFHTQGECESAYISLKPLEGDVQKITATAVNFFKEKYPEGVYTTYVHIFDFQNLEFSQTYEYSCYGSDEKKFLKNYEGPFRFYVPAPNPTDQETKVVMFADMDHSTDGMVTVNRLTEISQNNFTDISAFIHVGDMGYNFYNEAGKRGDNYMNTVQKFTATMPYMVTAGNHEVFGNFSNFNARFQMPNFDQSQNHYHSYNIGNMHFVSFNLDFVIQYPKLRQYMLDWLEQDLQKANENRGSQPWIIAYTHRPFYCSFGYDPDCNYNHQRFSKFEDLLIKYNVDLVVSGHVHYYERMLPIKRNKIAPFQVNLDDTNFNEIINPSSPIYLLQGMAGHRGDKADPSEVYYGKAWTVKVSKAYSYISVKSQNSTHLLVENFRSKDQKANDYFYVIKSNSLKYAKAPYQNVKILNARNNELRMENSLLWGLFLACLYLVI